MMPPTELLAAVLRGEPVGWPPDATKDDEDALVHAADVHGVMPLVAFSLGAHASPESPTGNRWPRHLLEDLGERAAQAAAVHVVRMRELTCVLARLASTGVRPVLTKGVVLAHTHYAQPHLRPSFDVDLFVAQDDLATTARAFEDLGYRRSRQIAGHLVMPQFDYQKQCELGVWHLYDVHFRAVNPQVFADALTYRELAAEAEAIDALGPYARGTAPRHALLLACLHRVAHHPSEDRLIWLYDIHVLAERLRPSGLQPLARAAADKKVCGVVGAGLAAAREVFHTALPDGLLEDLEERSLAAKEESRSFIDGQTKLGVLWSDLRVVPRWRDRVRLLGQHVFPSSAYMLRRYEARSRALLPALYTHRLFTGAWRWLRLHAESGKGGVPVGKRLLDLVLSGGGLLLSMPLWAIIAAAIKLEDAGPVFYTQERVGEGGRLFTVFKFRSMVPNAEAVVGAVQATTDDPRVTRVGRLMRATAMDELPQLWNIFRGDMSFVGPRALRPSEIETAAGGELIPLAEIPGYAERSRLRPGLTGVAQIYAPRNVPRRHKFRFDRLYARKQGLWLDVRLILVSFWITFRGKWE